MYLLLCGVLEHYLLCFYVKNTTTYACAAADVEHACAVPCLQTEECMRMRRGTLENGEGRHLEEKNCWIRFFFFLHSKILVAS